MSMEKRIWDEQLNYANKEVRNMKEQHQEIVKLDTRETIDELAKARNTLMKFIGTIDTLRGLGLLDNITYQKLVEDNVRLEEKIIILFRKKKAQQRA